MQRHKNPITQSHLNLRISPFLLFLPACFIVFTANAQEKHRLDLSKVRYGFMYGWADQSPFKEADYSWEVNQLKFQINYPFKEGRTFIYEVTVEPQINFVKYRQFDRSLNRPENAPKSVADENHLMEFGLSLGGVVRYPISKNLSVYGMVSFGTFYLANRNNRVAEGIAFASQGSLGLRIKILKGTYWDFRAGMRHLSNAGLQKPNGGINTFHVESGILIGI